MRLPSRPRRSALYVPASNAKAIAKAEALPADIIILDLEDAVAPEAKYSARITAIEAVKAGGFGKREVLIRCNPLDSPWGPADLEAIASSDAAGILVPKVCSPRDIIVTEEGLRRAKDDLALWIMIETCAAVNSVREIAMTESNSRLSGLVLGTNDLAKEMRAQITRERAAFLPIFTTTILAARQYGLAVLDGVCNEFTELARFETECIQGLVLGFDGKTLIHPRQIGSCNEVYSPTAAEIEWAEAIVAAFDSPENAGRGVIQLNGKMVELLHADQARDLIIRYRAIEDLATRRQNCRPLS
ncbi:CoA ester lyase [Bradyrhizobium sp. B097]|uniref:HpcH/HpaI aldolase/citrate lyase family protein n=1 Tax=Bradyrhizobium sp. B097 TaxID=3140244 RepID=UPI0031836F5E